MWIAFAVMSAVFAGATSVLAKAGIKNVSSDFATAFRTVIVLAFSWIMVFVVGSQSTIAAITPHTLVFLILSGCATGLSWLCYFRALTLGNVGRVAAVDKSSTFITIILAIIIFGEPFSYLTVIGVSLMIVGTVMMIRKGGDNKGGRKAILYAVLSAVFASMQSILGKIGVEDVDSTLATAIRTVVVLIFAWAIVIGKGQVKDFKKLTAKDSAFLILSGFTTGGSWLCYYRALQTGNASVVVPIDKLSIIVSVILSAIFLKERQTKKDLFALAFILCGTMMLVFAK